MRRLVTLFVMLLVPGAVFAAPNMAVKDWRWRHDRIGNLIIEGVAQNNGDATCRGCKILISAYDKKGGYVGSGSTYLDISDVQAKGSSPFKLYVDNAQVSGNELKIQVQFQD